ncbi:hypothetical protein BS47DRAFT_72454 [Hydnum rufescens UP504]|uniref:Uncharacterized protein n=1 Tax=Hydnum rufescens UP504 TaxID=1448309 RepID=A0A9P6DZ52_9AGAM|nr:hypothetical protein BS47DRAFT_72454 [Hydnum rufescens UP504]
MQCTNTQGYVCTVTATGGPLVAPFDSLTTLTRLAGGIPRYGAERAFQGGDNRPLHPMRIDR